MGCRLQGSEMLLSSPPATSPSLLNLSVSPGQAVLQGRVISSYDGALPKIAASCPVRCQRQPVMQRFRKRLHHGEWV